MLSAIVLTLVVLLLAPGDPTPTNRRGEGPATAKADLPKDAPRFVWLADDGAETWSLRLDPTTTTPGREPDPASVPTLHAPPWFPRLPPLEVERIGEAHRTSLSGFAGKVLLIHFWASWCEPCAEELPWLQRLEAGERSRGLAVLTVNMNETDEVARGFARSLGVDLPIARYTPALDGAFQVRSLPAVLVVDRRQRIRERIDGYAAGIERAMETLVRGLLEEDVDPGPEIARVRHGTGLLEVRWSRSAAAGVEALAVLPTTGAREGGVVVACGRTVETYGPAGRTVRTEQVLPGIDRVRSAGDSPHILGFRPGGHRVLPLVFGGEVGEPWEAPSATLDLLVERTPDQESGTALIGTTGGLYRLGWDGVILAARNDVGVVLRIGAAAGGGVALTTGGRLIWFDPDLEVLRQTAAPAGTRFLAAFPALGGGLGLGPQAVVSVAAGRLLGDGRPQLAVAVEDRLLVVDLDTGRERIRADWPGIRALAAGDLDGDGRDDLVVGSGQRVTTLASPARESSMSE